MSLPPDYFQKLVESCPDIIIAVNRSGTVIFYNDGAQRTLGFTQEEMLGKHVLEIYPSRDEAKKVMGAMRGGEAGAPGKVCSFETVFKTKKGEEIPVAISASIFSACRARCSRPSPGGVFFKRPISASACAPA